MARTRAEKLAYGRGYNAGRNSIWGDCARMQRLVDEAVARAKRAESGQGLLRCDECARWDRATECMWGYCNLPKPQQADGEPLWAQAEDGRFITSQSFGCKLAVSLNGCGNPDDRG